MAKKFWRLLLVFGIFAAPPCATAIARDGQMPSVPVRLCVYWVPATGTAILNGIQQAKGSRYRLHEGKASRCHHHRPRTRIVRYVL